MNWIDERDLVNVNTGKTNEEIEIEREIDFIQNHCIDSRGGSALVDSSSCKTSFKDLIEEDNQQTREDLAAVVVMLPVVCVLIVEIIKFIS